MGLKKEDFICYNEYEVIKGGNAKFKCSDDAKRLIFKDLGFSNIRHDVILVKGFSKNMTAICFSEAFPVNTWYRDKVVYNILQEIVDEIRTKALKDIVGAIGEKTLINIVADCKNRDVDKLYAIRHVQTGEIIWNARGSAYKEKSEVKEKIKKLNQINPTDDYEIVVYQRTEG